MALLRAFASLGWSAFATCDARHTGGWAEKESLFCVADSYDLSSEHFAVSYLAHEAQHFSDYRAFPKLQQPELEYRAKLVELIESKETTLELARLFESAAADADRATAPHSYANRVIARDLSRTLGLTRPEELRDYQDAQSIRRAAAALFRANTAQLQHQGASTVTQAI